MDEAMRDSVVRAAAQIMGRVLTARGLTAGDLSDVEFATYRQAAAAGLDDGLRDGAEAVKAGMPAVAEQTFAASIAASCARSLATLRPLAQAVR